MLGGRLCFRDGQWEFGRNRRRIARHLNFRPQIPDEAFGFFRRPRPVQRDQLG